jgi:hypothetical protein
VGLAPDQVRARKQYGGGYPANVEGLHQLHCLVSSLDQRGKCDIDEGMQNLLRQSLYYNYEYYLDKGEGAFKNEDYIVKKHVCKYSCIPKDLSV